MAVFPAPSSFALAAGRLGWALQDVETVSLCGPPLETLLPFLQPNRRVLVLSADESTPQAVARFLTGHGFGASTVIVLEALGGPDERIRRCPVRPFRSSGCCTVELNRNLRGGGAGRPGSFHVAAGLADRLFESDGTMTKRGNPRRPLSSLAAAGRRTAPGISAPFGSGRHRVVAGASGPTGAVAFEAVGSAGTGGQQRPQRGISRACRFTSKLSPRARRRVH